MTDTLIAADEPDYDEYRHGWRSFCDGEDAPGRHASAECARGFSDALATRQRTMRFIDAGQGSEWHEVDAETLAGMVELAIGWRREKLALLCRNCLTVFDGSPGRALCDDCELIAA
jgi:hypothetical protein